MEQTSTTQFVINSTVKPNSFEYGSAGNRHKIFYDNPVELELHIKALKDKDGKQVIASAISKVKPLVEKVR